VARAPLTVELILGWADAHRARDGRWPQAGSGPVAGAPGETWEAVNRALMRGSRGLPGGSSLASLLAEHRGKRNKARAPRLREGQILAWADRHFRRAGRWPTPASGPLRDAPGENWAALAAALWAGNRGLRGGVTLRQFLLDHGRRVPETRGRPPRGAPAGLARALLRPFPADAMRAGPVGTLVSNPRNDGPGCLERS
jgi:hypothetical protein